MNIHPMKLKLNNHDNIIHSDVVCLKKKASQSKSWSNLLQLFHLTLGFNVGSEIKLHKQLSWYPVFSFAVGIPTEEDSGNPITALGLTAPILIAEHVYLGPTFALSEGDLSWGVTAGILISFDTAGNENNGW